MLSRTLASFGALGVLACAGTPVVMTPEGERIRVGRSDPSDNYELIGPVTAHDGNGCGLYGRRGTHDNAITALRVKAATMGADYVAITTITEPHLANPSCFANPYTISGMAYRKIATAPSPIPIQNVEGSSTEVDLVERLRELHDLYEAGALSDEEFERAKAKLLE